MKFILSFLFTFVFISPVMATVAESCAVISTNASGCSLGCEDTTGLGEGCYPCLSGYYNNGTFTDGCHSCSGNSDYEAIQQDQTKQHPAGASSCSDWECTSGTPIDTDNDNIVDSCADCDPNSLPSNAVFVDASCNWICNAGWYRYNNGCASCPTGYVNPVAGATSISQCNCPTGQNIIADQNDATPYFCGVCDNSTHYDNFSCVCDIQKANYDDNLTSCSCPGNSSNNNGTCVCQGQRVMVRNSQGQYECQSCAANAEYVDGACRCRAGYYGDGQTSCTPCPNGSVTVVNGSCGCSEGVTDGVCGDENCPGAAGATEISQCQCKPNYYKVGDTDTFSCSLCPAGTFSDLNSSGIGSCQMNHNTQFCDANGENCMQLIPES